MADFETAKRIKLLRTSKGLTIQEAADALEMPKSTYAHYEDGSNEPKISVLIKLAVFYQISVDWLVGAGEYAKAPPPQDRWEVVRGLIESLDDDEFREVYSYVKYLKWRSQQAGK